MPRPHAPTASLPDCSWLAALLLVLPALAGQVYQWKDAKGVTHYLRRAAAGPAGCQNRTARAMARAPPAEPTATQAQPRPPQLRYRAQATWHSLKSDRPGGPGRRWRRQARPGNERRGSRKQQVQLTEQTLKTYCDRSPPLTSAMRLAWAIVGGIAVGVGLWWWSTRDAREHARVERERKAARRGRGRPARALPLARRPRRAADHRAAAQDRPQVPARRPRALWRHRSPRRPQQRCPTLRGRLAARPAEALLAA